MSQSDISYSCGSCGYPLNLTSSNRITSNIGSGYQKSIKNGPMEMKSIAAIAKGCLKNEIWLRHGVRIAGLQYIGIFSNKLEKLHSKKSLCGNYC
ncbi:uncharacterized protein LOC133681840 isoform X3 [Populus nigra]|uniref:uncharacterized protein LOC133681840 isoform X3 n=1 Tax=Populus nigra TaxID=3691 RepID=UPI002B27B081|nr:uncharacterized protein LOC133681840 isoform X3 [Populus nigra]